MHQHPGDQARDPQRYRAHLRLLRAHRAMLEEAICQIEAMGNGRIRTIVPRERLRAIAALAVALPLPTAQ